MKKSTLNLKQRELDIIYDTGRYKYMTSKQHAARHFPDTRPHHASRRLTTLATNNFLTRQWFYPRSTTDPKGGQPTALYLFSTANKQQLQTHLENTNRADLYHDFEHLPTTDTESIAAQAVWHETALTDLMLAFNDATTNTDWQLLMLERIALKSKTIPNRSLKLTRKDPKTKTETTVYRHFNPDLLTIIKDPAGVTTLYVIEYDNGTHSDKRIRENKFESFIGYANQKHFPTLIDNYATKYLLDIPDPKSIPVYYLMVTPNTYDDHRRRNHLFLLSLEYKIRKQWLFASITDLDATTILTAPVWHRPHEHRDHARKLFDALPTGTTSAVQSREKHIILNDDTLSKRIALMHT